MKVTICELSNPVPQFEKEWVQLAQHCQSQESDLLLLPEMPFYPWIANQRIVREDLKIKAVEAHEQWLQRIEELGAKMVAYSKPEIVGEHFYNTAYVWTQAEGHQAVHSKHFFPEEEGFYEQSWFDTPVEHFELLEVQGINIGFLLCTEVWFTQYARKYGLAGIDLLLCPRATGKSSLAQWIRCGQTLSVISGAYCVSSNRSGAGDSEFEWGGGGWISRPMDGQLLGRTTSDSPFLTLNIDVNQSKVAKDNYPLYVKEDIQ